MQDKTEWKLNGQVLVFTLPLSDQARSLLTWPLPLLVLLLSFFTLRRAVDPHGRSCKTLDVPHAAAPCPAGLRGWGSSAGCLYSRGGKNPEQAL